MINLVIDIGNTFSKLAIFNNRVIKSVVQIDNLSAHYLRDFLEETLVDNSVISSVNTEIEDFEALLKSKTAW